MVTGKFHELLHVKLLEQYLKNKVNAMQILVIITSITIK